MLNVYSIILTHRLNFFLRTIRTTHTSADRMSPPHRTINIPDATSISISLLLAFDLWSGQLGRRHHLENIYFTVLTFSQSQLFKYIYPDDMIYRWSEYLQSIKSYLLLNMETLFFYKFEDERLFRSLDKNYAQFYLLVYIFDVKMETTICASSGDDVI